MQKQRISWLQPDFFGFAYDAQLMSCNIIRFLATFGDLWLRQGSYAEGRGQKGKEGKCPKLLLQKLSKPSSFCLLPSALKRVSVLITKI